jgi:succinyl-CoA synthetase beta subunit
MGGAAAAVRFLNVHEYISMEIMQSHGIRTPKYQVASTPQEAEDIFSNVLNQRECIDCWFY